MASTDSDTAVRSDSEHASPYDADIRQQHAREAGLRYVNDDQPGIRRKRRGRGFIYLSPGGERVVQDETLERIRLLAIPPAYRDVWICPWPKGHLQATGRDARGRKQYRYHPDWLAHRNANKFTQLAGFAAALPLLRERVEADLKGRGPLDRTRVLALVVSLLDATAMRIGNDVYARENGTFGLTTLRKRHVSTGGQCIKFEYKGKHGKRWRTSVCDRKLATLVQRCEELPGQALFQYVDEEGERRLVRSEDVNAYLREISGQPFTAKDFRTWTATTLAMRRLLQEEPGSSKTALQRQVNAAVREVAEEMGHTAAICRKCYIYPAVLEGFASGALRAHFTDLQDEVAFHAQAMAYLQQRGETKAAKAIEKSARLRRSS